MLNFAHHDVNRTISHFTDTIAPNGQPQALQIVNFGSTMNQYNDSFDSTPSNGARPAWLIY